MSKILLLIQGNDDLHVHFICAKSLHLCPSPQMGTNLFQIWTVASQAPLSMRFSRQECWSGLPFISPGALPDPGIKPTSPVTPALQVDSFLLSHQGRQIIYMFYMYIYIRYMIIYYIILAFTFRSLIHLELIAVDGVR